MYDHHKTAREIARRLREENIISVADQVDDAMSGSTGTEILMALRWHLSKFLDEGGQCSQESKNLITELIREITRVLQ